MRRLGILLLLAALEWGCDGEPTVPVPAIEGTYILQTIDGHALPTTSGGMAVLSSTITLGADGRFSRIVEASTSQSGSTQLVTTTEAGHWSASGLSVTLSSAVETHNGTVRQGGHELDLDVNGGVWAHSR
jgi:hypothetical protein